MCETHFAKDELAQAQALLGGLPSCQSHSAWCQFS